MVPSTYPYSQHLELRQVELWGFLASLGGVLGESRAVRDLSTFKKVYNIAEVCGCPLASVARCTDAYRATRVYTCVHTHLS